MDIIAALEEIQDECQTIIDEVQSLDDRLDSIWWDIWGKIEKLEDDENNPRQTAKSLPQHQIRD